MNLFKCTKYQLIFNMLILCFTFSFICSCGDDDDKEILNNEVVPPSEEDDDSNDDFLDVALPELSAVELSEIDFYGTTISAMIYSDGGDIITERGFCLSSTSKVPTINDQKIIVDSDAYKISALISEFAEVTTYYVRAYAINSVQEDALQPLDWMENTCPEQWLINGERVEFNWLPDEGVNSYPPKY